MPRKTRSEAAAALPTPSPARAPHNLFAGTSGWAYPSWKPGFYPAKVPARQFLASYSTHLNSVEVNYTFRKLPSATQLQSWLDATPSGFRFSFKAPQRITHFQRLRESQAAVKEFVETLGPVRSAGKLGLLLFQLPPNFKPDPVRLADLLAAPALCGLRIALEFRHPGWFSDEIFALLRSHGAALCVAEGDELKTPDIATAAFRCYRLRRSGGYSERQVAAFARRIAPLAATGEVFVYFRHEDEPTGALNAASFLRRAAKAARVVR